MAVYKVAQDVEADDKLIGPFSFRQFVYLIIVAMAIALAFGLSRVFVPLAILPLPVILFFGAIALPLRKDQPMEVYMAAIVSYHLKPKKRLWQADGIESQVEITAPKTVEVQRTKEIGQEEAERRLSYLADIADTGGWSVRGVTSGNAMINDVYFAAQQAEDILDDSGSVSHNFDTMINRADQERRQAMIEKMRMAAAPPPPPPAPSMTAAPVAPTQQPEYQQAPAPVATAPVAAPAPQYPVATPEPLIYNPYPAQMHQTVVQPLSAQTPSTSENTLSRDMMNLVENSSDLSVETIAHEAKRIKAKQDNDDEVVISLH